MSDKSQLSDKSQILGEGRVLAEGVIPRVLALPVTATGVNDEALQSLEKLGDIVYIEREFMRLTDQQGLIGMYMIYLEIKQNVHSDLSQAKVRFDHVWEQHLQKEGTTPLSAEAYARAQRLKKWRGHTAKALKYPPYAIMNNQQLYEIATRNPATLSGFKAIKGFGDKRIRRYGEAVINILKAHADELSAQPNTYTATHTIERVSNEQSQKL